MKRNQGFTLIELLTVIAIIAVLAAIIFPVFTRAKDAAYRSSDISNMNTIRTALQLYRIDQGGYPPALLGFVDVYRSGPNFGQPLPPNVLTGFLYPKRVDSLETFRPANNRLGQGAVLTQVVWPNQDPSAVGSSPQLDLDGDGAITAADDPANARQAFGPSTTVTCADPLNPGNTTTTCYYAVDGYDAAEIPLAGGGRRYDLRYTLFWTVWGTGSGNAFDDPRQLGYSDPSDNTVITWNGYFRDWNRSAMPNPIPLSGKRDIILFLGGSAKTYDSLRLHTNSWRVTP